MVFPTIMPANSVSDSYEISNSLRFNAADSPRLTRTPSSAGNRRTFTLSVWFKLQVDASPERIFIAADDGTDNNNNFDGYIAVNAADKIIIYAYEGSEKYYFVSTQVLRDPNAWYHLVVAFDTTQGTAANRVKIYLNGSQVTSFSTANYPGENHQTRFNNSNSHKISSYPDHFNSSYFDGYMAEYHWIGGAAKAPSDFGEFDNNGVWVPIEYEGSYGTNGFYLEFQETGTSANSSGIGADTSGNDHHWAVTNLAATDVTTDTPTNNFATWNAAVRTTAVFTEGNTQIAAGAPGYYPGSYASIVPTNGKWYAEFKVTVATYGQLGILTASTLIDGARNVFSTTSNIYWQDNNTAIALYLTDGDGTATDSGNAAVSGGSNSVPEYGTDVISIALDMDNGKGYFAKNGTFVNSSNPANGTNSFTLASDYADGSTFYFGGNNFTVQANFGNPPYAPDSGNADANGHGNFEYAVPSGYFALCSKNLAKYG